MIERTFATMTVEEIVHRLDSAGIANGRLNDLHDFAAHEQLRARDRWRAIDTEAGRIDTLLPPTTLGAGDPVMGALPKVGEHTSAILAELGYDRPTIDRMRETRAI